MNIDVYLIRHGQSATNLRPDLLSGRTNHAPLTEQGEAEARDLGRLLRGRGLIPAAVYTSPAVRTQQTTRLCLESQGIALTPIIVDELQELDQGAWEGMPRQETFDAPLIKAEIQAQGLDFSAPGGESMRDTAVRVLRWLNSLEAHASPSEDTHVMFAFTHIMTTRSTAAQIAGWTRPEAYQHTVPNTSLSLLQSRDRIWRVAYLGRMAHELDQIVQ